ncbi:MAG: oxidoreductase [Nocardioides sp.]|nr:oxidoreductase [Nocardioides sp.]
MTALPTSPTSSPVRTAVIGYGLSGRVFHAPFLSTSPEFSLDFIVSRDPGRVAAATREHPNAMIVGSMEELLERHADQVDLVVLGTPPHTHHRDGLAALEAGCALVIDKPFAASSEEAADLIAAAEQRGLPLMVFQNRRWDGDFMTVRAIVESGDLGEIYQFESSFEHWAPDAVDRWHDTTPLASGGGVTFDLGSHLVDQALLLFGPVADVVADVRCMRAGGANDDVSFVRLVHDSGVHSRLFMSRLGAQPGPRFRVLGTRGAYVSYGLDGQEPALAAGAKPTDDDYGVEPPSTWGTLGVRAAGCPDPVSVPTLRGDYPAFYAAAAAAIRGTGPLPVDTGEALEVLRTLERIHRAAGN